MNSFYDEAINNLHNRNYEEAANNFFRHLYYNGSNWYNFRTSNIPNMEERNKFIKNVEEYFFTNYNGEESVKYADLGMINFYIGNNNQFVNECFENAFKLSDDFRLLNIIGLIHLKSSNYKKAVECFNKAVELKPDCGGLYYNLHIAHSFMNNYDLAFYNLDKASKLDKNPYYSEHNQLIELKINYFRLMENTINFYDYLNIK